MIKELLQKVIDKGVEGYLNEFFQDVSKYYTELEDDLSEYDGNGFSDFQAIGGINFSANEKLVVVTANVTRDLTERNGKRDQYEKAKKILKAYMRYDAGVFVFSDPAGSFRLSLVYGTPDATRLVWSNFRRFTYFVSRDQTNNTFLDRVGNCSFSSLDIIKDAFSVEKVNKEFYKEIAKYYYRLTGKNGYARELVLPSVREDDNKKYEEFSVRLIGRIIFCWFLKHKKSANGIPLVPKEALSVSAVQSHMDYYHFILEPLFFEVMNKPVKDRKPVTIPQSNKIPFLNGGLFEPHVNDCYQNMPNFELKIPDEWFGDFFSVLEQYNFTIDENSTVDADVSVDPEMLGRIFENLLAEVVPETGEIARKATGSYYTPRTIVDYMVDQSLKQYLVTKTKIEEDKINDLLSYEAPEVALSESEKGSISSALDEIKIIDPACGSGAFPMGILHKMLLVLRKADPDLKLWLKNHLGSIEPGIFKDRLLERIRNENWEYVRKLLIIQKSIYGVDIQTIAVEISKLRFFLSLIVDEQIDDLKENRGVEALPNLEFKFVAANSLIGLPPVINRQVGLGIVSDEITRLKELRNRYLRSYGQEKKQIEEDFLETRGELIEPNIKWGGKDTLALQLGNWNPFSNEKSDWFDSEWMFGVTDGFDIVIANPPYIGEKSHKDVFSPVRQGILGRYYLRKMDYFYFFLHLALNITSSNGQISFITTNYYLTADGAKKLRQDLKARAICRRLINLGELKIFENARGQHNIITILSKGNNSNLIAENCITKRTALANNHVITKIFSWHDEETSYYRIPQHYLFDGEECYIRLAGIASDTLGSEQAILSKIKNRGYTLGSLFNVNQGVLTGVDRITNKHIQKKLIDEKYLGHGVYVISKNEMQKLNLPENEKQFLRPFYKNSAINKYYCDNNPKSFLLYIKRDLEIKRLPQICSHLMRFEKVIKARSEDRGEIQAALKLGKWWVIFAARAEEIFTEAKIICPQRSYENTFAYSESEWFASADVYFITRKHSDIELKYILSILNSKLYYFWLYHNGKRKGRMLELFYTPLTEIPIKKISLQEQKPFISLVDQILAITKDEEYLTNPIKQAKVKELEREIDQMVYELYGLTGEEIAVVEGTTEKRG